MATVTVNGAKVHYEKTGSGPALVLVHGTGSAGAALTWGQTAPRFASRHTVVTPDLSGSEATADDGGPLTAEGLAAQVVAVIEEVTDGPVDLLGFSMGSTVAATVAALRPDLVRRLILVAGWAHTDGDAYLRSLFTLWKDLGTSDPASFGRAVAMTGFSRGFLNAISREAFDALIPNMPPTPGTLRHVDYDLRVDIRPLLPRIEAPTLVIGGTQDITVPVEHSRALHAAITGSSYAELDAGHVMLFEQEDTFVELVTDYINSPATAGA
ncbi:MULTISPECIES: alpha/beta hydrolase [unclassified Streptomyces]|uniref:alpha/beta fold hydrolase n=1 Tax=unclassified Streptomyces TaxID=2593676 RepID=UPI002ED65B40|nr:alpha/beta hydrolase [Streptomyces sp. NBC_00891]WSY09606.1 alpha/beta hydrolase [Streptomyces sp. NBC_00890]WSZ11226.1 alpha/beta hydrolase [Streptomyces sp. NBC_00869]WSZ21269.1 alpha/beta hydrolase [Streptomyces sp. NBC_00870]